MLNILFEDRDIAVVLKPAGLLSTADRQSPEYCESVDCLICRHREENGEAAEIFTVQRLDRGVGGVMVFAKNAAAAAKLSGGDECDKPRKEYYAVVKGCPVEDHGCYHDLLFKDAKKNKTFVVDRMRRGVREAVLDYSVLKTTADEEGGNMLSLVKIELQTGRTHQIRVQFSSRKMPLVGDGKYGGADNRAANIALLSHSLAFTHPRNGERMTFSAEIPDEYPWSEFLRR